LKINKYLCVFVGKQEGRFLENRWCQSVRMEWQCRTGWWNEYSWCVCDGIQAEFRPHGSSTLAGTCPLLYIPVRI